MSRYELALARRFNGFSASVRATIMLYTLIAPGKTIAHIVLSKPSLFINR